MPECDNPLWPCAMTGAAACLAGFEGMTVVIHGSSGCYYYPATLLHAPLYGTFIMETEVIFGSEQRLCEVLDGLFGHGNKIAVIMTCIPSILGEDLRAVLADYDAIVVDSPGFSGDIEAGYKNALSVLAPSVEPGNEGINIDGACLFDPYSGGNVQEVVRLLNSISVPVGTVFCRDQLEKVWHSAPYTVGTNADFSSGIGTMLGGMLGFDEIRSTLGRISNTCPGADPGPVEREMERGEEKIVKACDKFLRRFDPPHAVIFGNFSYAVFAAGTLKHYLDADILFIGSRNKPGNTSFPVGHVQGYSRVKTLIRHHDPDLVLGSSFEQSVDTTRAFVGLAPPIRGTVKLAPHSLAGVTGTLAFMENVLNACMDRKK